MTEPLERQLDSFDPRQRREALSILWRESQRDGGVLPRPNGAVNLHAHTFYSYNVYGYSPSKYAWLARKAGLGVAGIVDADVLDGLEEFLEAGRLIGLKTCVSIECRVFVPEFKTRVINSPGEPGVAYYMGVGFTKSVQHPFLTRVRGAAQQRIRDMLALVNGYLDPVRLDYERDVVPLTPNGNATERHLCEAYERKAALRYPDPAALAEYWRGKLGSAPPAGAPLQSLIRAKTMKLGGVGYVPPADGAFPTLVEMSRFAQELGAIPTFAWLDGTSAGESAIVEMFEVAAAAGTAALNIIPDRNYSRGVKDRRLQNLYDVVELAERYDFPVIVGTEMNAPGNKFVDSFAADELRPVVPAFLKGANIVYAHSVLQRQAGLGYLSPWANRVFAGAADKNRFFERLGSLLTPASEDRLRGLTVETSPEEILAKLG